MKVSPLVSKIDQYPKAFYAHDFELAASESEKNEKYTRRATHFFLSPTWCLMRGVI
jgi:hypothetical protein